MFIIYPWPIAVLCNSSLHVQRFVGWKAGVEGMCPAQAIQNIQQGPTMYSIVMSWRIGRHGRGEKERDKEKENSLGRTSCNNCSDGVVQNSICSVLLHSQPCHPSNTFWVAEKTFRGDHTGHHCKSQIHVVPPESCSAVSALRQRQKILRGTSSNRLEWLWECGEGG